MIQLNGRMSESAKARGVVGFLHPQRNYEVKLGTKVLYHGNHTRTALATYRRWYWFGKDNSWWSQGQQVTITSNGRLMEAATPRPFNYSRKKTKQTN